MARLRFFANPRFWLLSTGFSTLFLYTIYESGDSALSLAQIPGILLLITSFYVILKLVYRWVAMRRRPGPGPRRMILSTLIAYPLGVCAYMLVAGAVSFFIS